MAITELLRGYMASIGFAVHAFKEMIPRGG